MATDPPNDGNGDGRNGSGAHRLGPDDLTPDPTEEMSVGVRVARELAALVHEMAEHRQMVCDRESNLTGLINMLSRRGTKLEGEHVERVADIVQGAGNDEHTLGSKMYARAERIRAAGKKVA